MSAQGLGLAFPVAVLLLAAASVGAQDLVEMQHGLPNARFVPAYSIRQREGAVQRAMELSSQPILDAAVSLTPDAPYAPDGSHLSFWKPSFVIGTASGGEAGINFWGKFQEGHMNVALAPTSIKPIVLDCRMLSAGNIAYKVYAGNRGTLRAHGEAPLRDSHFLLTVSVSDIGRPISVELWPTPETQPIGIFGCEISTINQMR